MIVKARIPPKSRNTLKSVSEGTSPDWNSSCPITCVQSLSIAISNYGDNDKVKGNHRAKGKGG